MANAHSNQVRQCAIMNLVFLGKEIGQSLAFVIYRKADLLRFQLPRVLSKDFFLP